MTWGDQPASRLRNAQVLACAAVATSARSRPVNAMIEKARRRDVRRDTSVCERSKAVRFTTTAIARVVARGAACTCCAGSMDSALAGAAWWKHSPPRSAADTARVARSRVRQGRLAGKVTDAVATGPVMMSSNATSTGRRSAMQGAGLTGASLFETAQYAFSDLISEIGVLSRI